MCCDGLLLSDYFILSGVILFGLLQHNVAIAILTYKTAPSSTMLIDSSALIERILYFPIRSLSNYLDLKVKSTLIVRNDDKPELVSL